MVFNQMTHRFRISIYSLQHVHPPENIFTEPAEKVNFEKFTSRKRRKLLYKKHFYEWYQRFRRVYGKEPLSQHKVIKTHALRHSAHFLAINKSNVSSCGELLSNCYFHRLDRPDRFCCIYSLRIKQSFKVTFKKTFGAHGCIPLEWTQTSCKAVAQFQDRNCILFSRVDSSQTNYIVCMIREVHWCA